MPTPQPNGPDADSNGRPGAAGADLVTEAEAVRDLLHEAAGRTARLVAALKHQRRQARAVHQAVQSLRELRLDH